MFDNILEQEIPKSTLSHFILSQKLPHSYLFYGTEGIGKFLTAKTFAKILNCENEDIKQKGHDNCLSCKKIDDNNHPDVFIVEPKGQSIKIDDIRELIRKLNLKSFESPNKIVIINNAEKMTEESANTLLKTLEEPPNNTYIILITSQIEIILPTIRSRCIKIPFQPLSSKTVQNILETQGIETEQAYSLSLISEGSLMKAQEFLDKENYDMLKETLNTMLTLISERVIKIPKLLEITQFFSHKTEKEKLIFDQILNILYLFWRDTLLRESEILSIPSFVPTKFRISLSETGILKIIDLLESANRELKYNVNPALMIEYLVLEIHKIIQQHAKE